MYNIEEDKYKTTPLTEDEYHTLLGYLDDQIIELQHSVEYKPSEALVDNENYIQFI